MNVCRELTPQTFYSTKQELKALCSCLYLDRLISANNVEYLTADGLQLVNKVLSLVRREMSNVDTFICSANSLSRDLLPQQLIIHTHTYVR